MSKLPVTATKKQIEAAHIAKMERKKKPNSSLGTGFYPVELWGRLAV